MSNWLNKLKEAIEEKKELPLISEEQEVNNFDEEDDELMPIELGKFWL